MKNLGERQEIRAFDFRDFEVREEADSPPVIVGYAAVFNQRSKNLGGFVEEIAPGAFRRTLESNPDVRAAVQHEQGLMTIGRTRNGTLQMEEDEHGLRVRIRPPDTQPGRDALTLVRGGFIDQMSFQFRVPKGGDDWKRTADGTPLRRLLDVDLDGGDVAIVTGPAYPQTSAEVRAMATQFSETGSGVDDAEGGQSTEDVEGVGLQAQPDYRRRQLEIVELEINLTGGSEQ